jgi:septal ring factor EnvC (AmiA/AmiB activator)
MCTGARGRIIHDGSMANEPTTYAQIATLLEAVTEERGPSLARLEDTLTAGYACALALEAERMRLERRIAEVAGKLGDDDSDLRAQELGALAAKLSCADADLTKLRGVLTSLKQHAREARRAEVALS